MIPWAVNTEQLINQHYGAEPFLSS